MMLGAKRGMVLKAGEMLGPYEIVGTLGQGGMAIVYKGHHPKLDRYVAIKILHNIYLQDPVYVARFEREAQIVARLEDPHIVPVYDFAEHNGQPYLVMKFIEGRTLKSVILGNLLPQTEILRIMSSLADALDYAHAQGVLHRDIKPSNILIDQQGVPYLTDFGLARIAEAGESTISKDMLLGTPQYIAPEQAHSGQTVSPRTDLYAFGVVLYELLTGRVPFSGDTSYAIIHDQIYTPPPPPNQVNPALSPDVSVVLLKALAKNPKDRYASAGEMMTALTNTLTPSSRSPLRSDFGRPKDADPLPPSPSGRGVQDKTVPSVANTGSYSQNSNSAGSSSASIPDHKSFSPRPEGEGSGVRALPPAAVPNFTFDGAKPKSVAQPVQPSKRPAPGRRWLIGGLVALAVIAILMAINLSGALRDVDQLSASTPPTKTPATKVAPTAIIVAPTAVLVETPQVTASAFALLNVPNLSQTQAQIDAAAYPKDPSIRIAVARALWNAGQIDPARSALDDGAAVAAAVGSNIAAYYLSAATVAQQDRAPQAAAYADIRALNAIAATDADYPTVRNLAGEDLYAMARAAGTLSAADIRRITDKIGASNPITDAMSVRALITDTRYTLAQSAIERLLAQQSTLAEAHLVLGDLYAARGSNARAKDEWKTAKQTADAPNWVVQQATTSLSAT